MTGTIILTGANSSLAIPAVEHLLAQYPNFTAVLTIRDASENDTNTKKLRTTIAQHPGAKTSIHELDLTNLSAVQAFASSIATEIAQDQLPSLASIICNAYYWNLSGPAETIKDGYEKTFQVIHVAHAALVLQLLGSFGPDGGRVVLFSSDAHCSGKNSLEKYPPAIPNDLELLVKPAANDPPDNFGRGFQRYAVSKLAVVMWMYALNRYLKKDPKLRNISAVAINPGNLSDSRALRTNTPPGADVVDLATEKAHPHEHGYFTLLKKDASAPASMDEEKQQGLWKKTLPWARITRTNTALTAAFA